MPSYTVSESNHRRPRTVHWLLSMAAAFSLLVSLVACKGKTEDERLMEAQQQLAKQNIPGAMIIYKEFLKKYPDSQKSYLARFGLAQAYYMDGDFQKSRDILDEEIQRSGGVDTRTGLNAAMLKLDALQAQGKHQAALSEALATSASLHSVAPEFHQHFDLRVARLYSMADEEKGPDQALRIYRDLLSKKPAMQQYHLEALVQIAMLYDKPEELDKAIGTYLEFLDRYPDSELEPTVCVYLAKLLERQEKKDQAHGYFERATASAQKQLDAAEGSEKKSLLMFQLAQINEAAGKADEAQVIYREVIDKYPMGRQRPAAMMLLAQSLYGSGNGDKALEEFDRIMRSYPNTQHALQAYKRINEIRMEKSQQSKTGATTDTLTAPPPPSEDGVRAPGEKTPEPGSASPE